MTDESRFFVLDALVFAIHLGVAFSPFTIPLVAVFENLDTHYFVFNDILPDPCYRSFSQILTIAAVRFLLTMYCVADGGRFIAFLFTYFIIYLNNVYHTILLIDRCIYKIMYSYLWYLRLYLVSDTINKFVSKELFIFVSNAFWLSVAFCWFAVKGFGEVEDLVYFSIITVTFGIVVGTGCAFQYIIHLSRVSTKLLTTKQLEARKRLGLYRTRHRRTELKMIMNLKKVAFHYGRVYPVDEEFVSAYWINLSDNLVSALILFEFHS